MIRFNINKSHPVLIRYRLTRWLVWWSLVLCLIHAPVVMSQPDDDQIPPPLGVEDSSKTIAVALNFQDGIVTGHSANVVFGHAPARIGNPSLLRIDLFDFRGNFVEQFNAWNPLWTFFTDDTGSERLVLDTEATGDIAFPFLSEYGTMKVIDVEQEQEQEIISIDLVSTIRNFCQDNLDDPDCRNVADFDGDGDVDKDDLNLLLPDLNTLVNDSTCGAPCDLNVDGVINALDARQLVTLCTRPRCATQ